MISFTINGRHSNNVKEAEAEPGIQMCVCVMTEKFFLKEKTIIMRKRCDYSKTGHAAGPQHSWNVSLTNQTLELKPPIEPSPVETPQTGCKDAQPAAKCFFSERADLLGSNGARRVYE